MKARLLPIYFAPGRDEEFDRQVLILHDLLADQAEILQPVPLGAALPDSDAVLFPQLLGEAYRQRQHFNRINQPILIITSEFGTVSMWDWEIASYLRSLGVETIAPHSLEDARKVCQALAARRELREGIFLVFQDNPGEGFQASIFKRFYWWEDECTERMAAKFGVKIVKKSFRELGAMAQAISDEEAKKEWRKWPAKAGRVFKKRTFTGEVGHNLPADPFSAQPGASVGSSINLSTRLVTQGITPRALLSAVKVYLAVKRSIEEEGNILAAGINCLNESQFSDTTPCLAWAMLYEEQGLIWGCEADTVSMLTEVMLHRSLNVPLMMTNLYPFLMGRAATEHEHIPGFPPVEHPENCILTAHCGYLGVLPPSFSTEWTLRPKVLAIVDDNATAIDARLPAGPVTLAKLDSTLEKISVVEGYLESYAQFPGSHCLNGGVIRVPDGRKLLDNLPSHHSIILVGHHMAAIKMVSKVFNIKVEAIQ